MKLEDKISNNVWDHINDFSLVFRKMLGNDWSWIHSKDCKYVNLRIDMRSGACLIFNNKGKRISPEDLAYQYNKEEPK